MGLLRAQRINQRKIAVRQNSSSESGRWIPRQLPAQSDVEVWHDIIWQECNKLTLDQVAAFIEDADTIEKLAGELDGKEVHEWLKAFYATLKLDESAFQAAVNKRRIFPNQSGTFKRKADLSRNAGDINATLLDILELLGNDLRDELLDPQIDTDLEDLPKKDGGFVVKEISSIIENNLNDRAATKRLRPALAKLLLWFRENASRAKKLFPMLYDQKHLLYDDEEILNNIERAEELHELLSEYNVKNVNELRAVIEKHTATSQLLPVTQQIIESGDCVYDRRRRRTEMGKCEVCGNEYDKSFEVRMSGRTHVFDSFECAIHALAPSCAHCGCKIIGHGVEGGGTFYCCANCARQAGVGELRDRSAESAKPK